MLANAVPYENAPLAADYRTVLLIENRLQDRNLSKIIES